MKTFIALMILCSAVAQASQCAPPWWSVLPRKTVPEGGLLYVFSPVSGGFHAPEDYENAQRSVLGELWVETSAGIALPYELKLIHRGDAFDVFTLKVKAKVGTEFVVRPVQTQFAITVVKPEVSKPLTLEVLPGKEDNFRDTLSWSSTRALIPSLDAPAFRVTWRGGSVVLPGRLHWGSSHEAPLQLELGNIYCSEATARWSSPTEFTVTSLLSDGREVTAAPVMIEPPPPYESLPIRKFP
ncbi:MAG: hypothetical protein ACO1OB_34465 [Archangium sp.]